MLHDPIYRETYADNLRRDLPRIPLYDGFRRWRDWGQALLDLHLGYETIEPWPLERIDAPAKRRKAADDAPPPTPKPVLKADEAAGVIKIDSETMLTGVPAEAFAYKLGNRSAIGWVLDQHKEKTPRDPTIREKFDTYRFADHKERVIDLLKRVTRVSVETVRITEAMRKAPR